MRRRRRLRLLPSLWRRLHSRLRRLRRRPPCSSRRSARFRLDISGAFAAAGNRVSSVSRSGTMDTSVDVLHAIFSYGIDCSRFWYLPAGLSWCFAAVGPSSGRSWRRPSPPTWKRSCRRVPCSLCRSATSARMPERRCAEPQLVPRDRMPRSLSATVFGEPLLG